MTIMGFNYLFRVTNWCRYVKDLALEITGGQLV